MSRVIVTRRRVADLELPPVVRADIAAEIARYGFSAVAAIDGNRIVLLASRWILKVEKRVVLGGYRTVTAMKKADLYAHIATIMHEVGEYAIPPKEDTKSPTLSDGIKESGAFCVSVIDSGA